MEKENELKSKIGLLELVKSLENVSAACRIIVSYKNYRLNTRADREKNCYYSVAELSRVNCHEDWHCKGLSLRWTIDQKDRRYHRTQALLST